MTRRGLTAEGAVAAQALRTFTPAELRPKWDPDVLALADVDKVRDYVLGVAALQLLLGTETAGVVHPVSRQAVVAHCGRGTLDWIAVGTTRKGTPERAFRRVDVDRFFEHHRGHTSPPFHRLPVELRRALRVDY